MGGQRIGNRLDRDKVKKLKTIFHPRSIAVVGVSSDEARVPALWFKALLSTGFQGKVYAVNTKGGRFWGHKVWSSLTAIPGPVDLVISCPDGRDLQQDSSPHRHSIIYGLGFLGLRQPDIFSPAEAIAASRKYEKSALTPALAGEMAWKLQDFMTAHRPYLNADLTLGALAGQLDIPQHQLSQVINESIGQNLFDFVNGQRVEEAKRLLLDPRKSAYTVLAIAQEAGFNSKSVFNAVFKEQTGQTPSEFRQKAQKGTP